MTSEDGTMNSTNKRVRFHDPTVNDSPIQLTLSSDLTPKGTALLSVRNYAATLRKHLKPIITTAGETNIALMNNWMTKLRQHKRMEDDVELIPRSARINFEFRVNKHVEDCTEFVAINAETTNIISDFQIQLKQQIMKVLDIETKLLRSHMYTNLCKYIKLIVQAILVSEGNAVSPHLIVSTFMHYHQEEFLAQTTMELAEFNEKYKEVHELTRYPLPINAPLLDGDADMPDDPTQGEASNQNYAITLKQDAQLCYNAIHAAITIPVKSYCERMENIEIDISLKKLSSTADLEDAATAAKTRLALEPTANPELVKDLIREQVKADTQKVSAELGQLKRQMAQLISKQNGGKQPTKGGRSPKGGASSTKQVTNGRPKTKQSKAKSPNPGRDPKAADAAPASKGKGKGTTWKKKTKKRGERK